jgi:Ser/Thr protein kinase RdoA (MazF antagonist)
MIDASPAVPPSAADICRAFDLGAPLDPLVPVAGGSTNRVWRLTTERGRFAVKEMAGDLMPEWRAWIERAFRVETAAYDAGVPMPRPVAVPATGGCLAGLPGAGERPVTVRVHEWVDGEAMQRIVYGADVSSQAGGVLARIHGLRLAAEVPLAAALRVFGAEHWHSLAERVERSHIDWAWEFRAMLPVIAGMEAYVEAARADLTPLLLSHRDADQKNFMRTASGELMLVDWDAAGPVNPRHEVVKEALGWAGVHLGEPDWKAVHGFIDGYRQAGGELDVVRPTDLGEFVAVMVAWFEFNVRRMLEERAGDDAAGKLATSIVQRHFKHLPRVAAAIDRWAAKLR